MHFKLPPLAVWPESDDDWQMLSDDDKRALWASVSPRVLVDVSQSQLLKCATSLDYVHLDLEGEDIFTTFIEQHVIEAFYACVCTLGDEMAPGSVYGMVKRLVLAESEL